MYIIIPKEGTFRKLVAYTYKLINTMVIPIAFPTIVDLEKLSPNFAGEYRRRSNMILIDEGYWLRNKNDAKFECVVHTLCHEIGHAVHFNYLSNVVQYLPRKDPDRLWEHYNKNGSENFAECFADYCEAIFNGEEESIVNSKRLTKMKAILEQIESGGCRVVSFNENGEYLLDKRACRQYLDIYRRTDISYGQDYPYSRALEEVNKREIVQSPINDLYIENEHFDIPDNELHFVYDYLNPEISEERKIKLIGKRRLRNIYNTLRIFGIYPEDYIIPLV